MATSGSIKFNNWAFRDRGLLGTTPDANDELLLFDSSEDDIINIPWSKIGAALLLFNPLDYGATADGSSDGAALQTTISASVAGNGAVFLPADKTFTVTSSLTLPSNTTIIGANKFSSIIQASSSANDDIKILRNEDFGSGNSNISLNNFTVDGNDIGFTEQNSGSVCVEFQNVTNPAINDLRVTRGGIEGVYIFNSHNVIVTNLYAHDNGPFDAEVSYVGDASGLHLDSCEHFTVNGMIGESNGFHGILLTNSKFGYVDGEFYSNGFQGVYVQVNSDTVSINADVYNNFRGIYITDSHNITVNGTARENVNNYLTRDATGIIINARSVLPSENDLYLVGGTDEVEWNGSPTNLTVRIEEPGNATLTVAGIPYIFDGAGGYTGSAVTLNSGSDNLLQTEFFTGNNARLKINGTLLFNKGGEQTLDTGSNVLFNEVTASNLNISNWNSAYDGEITALGITNGNILFLSRSNAAETPLTVDLSKYTSSEAPVDSVFGRSGSVVAESGDYDFTLIAGTASDAQMPGSYNNTNWDNAYDGEITALTLDANNFLSASRANAGEGPLTVDLSPLASGGGGSGSRYLTDLSFDTGSGILTATVTGSVNPTVDLDDRWSLLGHSHTWSDLSDVNTTLAQINSIDQNLSTGSNVDFNSIDINGSSFVDSSRNVSARNITAISSDIVPFTFRGTSSGIVELELENTAAASTSNELSLGFRLKTDVQERYAGFIRTKLTDIADTTGQGRMRFSVWNGGSNNTLFELEGNTATILGDASVDDTLTVNSQLLFNLGGEQTLDTGSSPVFADATINGELFSTHTHTESDITDLNHYDSADFDTDFGTKSTTDLSEGTNLYFTNERVDDRVNNLLLAGPGITLNYRDADNILEISSSGGGGSSVWGESGNTATYDGNVEVDNTSAAAIFSLKGEGDAFNYVLYRLYGSASSAYWEQAVSAGTQDEFQFWRKGGGQSNLQVYKIDHATGNMTMNRPLTVDNNLEISGSSLFTVNGTQIFTIGEEQPLGTGDTHTMNGWISSGSSYLDTSGVALMELKGGGDAFNYTLYRLYGSSKSAYWEQAVSATNIDEFQFWRKGGGESNLEVYSIDHGTGNTIWNRPFTFEDDVTINDSGVAFLNISGSGDSFSYSIMNLYGQGDRRWQFTNASSPNNEFQIFRRGGGLSNKKALSIDFSTGNTTLSDDLTTGGGIVANVGNVDGLTLNTTNAGIIDFTTEATAPNWRIANKYNGTNYFEILSGDNDTTATDVKLRIDHNGNVTIPAGDLDISGSLSKGSGTFKIDHPLDKDNKHLYHGFIEGPRYDLVYRGTATLEGGKAVVNIDEASDMSKGTFIALTQNREVTSLQNKDSFDRVRASEIDDNGEFTIICEDKNSTDRVNWTVIAERADEFVKNHKGTDNKGRLLVEVNK